MRNVKTNQMNACRCNSEGAGVKMTSWLNNNFKLLALTLLAVLSVNVWGEEVTLTLNNIGAELSSNSEGSSGTTDVTATGSSTSTFTLNYGNAYQYDNNNAILLKKGTDGGTSFISNKTPMPGNIVSAIVYTAAGSSGKVTYYCSFKTTECSSRYATGTAIKIGTESSYTYNCTVEDAKYFCIAIGNSNNGQVIRIDVTYEAAGPSCTTPPTVSAGAISDATTNSLTFNCSEGITSLGSTGCSITEYGYVYGTSSDPTTSTKYKVGESYTTTGTAFGEYTATGLNCGTTYYMRPYAINGKGTAYGAQVSLATSACPVDHFIDNIQETTGYTGDGKAVSTSFTKLEITLSDKAATTSGSCEDVHYHFVGWVTEADRSARNVDAEHIVNFQDSGNTPTGATYYAVWAKEAE